MPSHRYKLLPPLFATMLVSKECLAFVPLYIQHGTFHDVKSDLATAQGRAAAKKKSRGFV